VSMKSSSRRRSARGFAVWKCPTPVEDLEATSGDRRRARATAWPHRDQLIGRVPRRSMSARGGEIEPMVALTLCPPGRSPIAAWKKARRRRARASDA